MNYGRPVGGTVNISFDNIYFVKYLLKLVTRKEFFMGADGS